MREYIDTSINPADYIEVWEVEDVEHGKQIVMAVDDLKCLPPADVRPVAEIDEAVDEAIRILNAINSRGNMDYADYCEMHDAISAISPNCGADMREEAEE